MNNMIVKEIRTYNYETVFMIARNPGLTGMYRAHNDRIMYLI